MFAFVPARCGRQPAVSARRPKGDPAIQPPARCRMTQRIRGSRPGFGRISDVTRAWACHQAESSGRPRVSRKGGSRGPVGLRVTWPARRRGGSPWVKRGRSFTVTFLRARGRRKGSSGALRRPGAKVRSLRRLFGTCAESLHLLHVPPRRPSRRHVTCRPYVRH